jgi:hypothetical protein
MPPYGSHGAGALVRLQIFVRNHAQAIVAYDFCVVVTVSFRFLYVFVVIRSCDPPQPACQRNRTPLGPMDSPATARSDPD